MESGDRIRLAAALTLAVTLASPILLPGLGKTDLGADEPIYAGLVDRMVASGSWLTPMGPDGPFLEKPPLKVWLVAAGMRLGVLPHDERGYRALDAVFGLLAIVYVVLIGRLAAGAACGAAAAVVLLADRGLVFEQGLRAHAMESLLVLSYCGGIHHLLAWARERGRSWHAFVFAGWCAVGFMAKFVAVAFLPVVAVVAVLLTPAWRSKAWEERGTVGARHAHGGRRHRPLVRRAARALRRAVLGGHLGPRHRPRPGPPRSAARPAVVLAW